MNSNQPIWTPENGALLQQLRINAGMDIGTLAHKNLITKNQVQQLEDGGDSGFYSPEIKYQIGKKLLAFYGHRLVRAEMARSKALKPDPHSQPVEPHKDQSAPRDAFFVPARQEPLGSQVTPSEVNPQEGTSSRPHFLTLIVLSVSCVSLWLLVRSSSHELHPSSSAPSMTAVESTVDAPDVARAQSQESATANESPPPPVAPATTTQAAATTDQCTWTEPETEVQAARPKKAPEYVYMVAAQHAFVCVMDGQERVTRLTLNSGEGKSVYGMPPFKVQSTALLHLKIFFQGQALNWPDADTRQVKLTAAAWN
jgi:cytoskeletal protein RodZ